MNKLNGFLVADAGEAKPPPYESIEDKAADLADTAFRMLLRGEDPEPYFRAEELGPYGACYREMLAAYDEAEPDQAIAAARAVLLRYSRADADYSFFTATDPALGKRSWYVNELYRTEFPEPRYLIPDLLPAGLAALGARPKIGKSWLGLQISVAVGTGGRMFDQPVQKGKVLYLALEDSARRMKQRLLKQGAPEAANVRFEFAWRPLLEGGMDELIDEIKLGRYALVVIDTLARAMGYLDPNKAAEMNVYLGALQRVAVDRNMTILLIDHHRKGNGGDNSDVIDDLIGATAKAGVLDVAMGLYRARGEKNATLKLTGRDIEERELAMHFDRETGCWECLGDAQTLAGSERNQEILDAIVKLGVATHREVADVTGQDKSNCFRRIQELVGGGKVRKLEGYPARYMVAERNSDA
jgi:hypothetical protein